MKKFVISFMIMFCLSLIGVSAFFMTGCGTASVSNGGGSSNPELSETPEDDNSTEEEPPAQADSKNCKITIKSRIMDSSTYVVDASTTYLSPSSGTWPNFAVAVYNNSGAKTTFGGTKYVTAKSIYGYTPSISNDVVTGSLCEFSWNLTSSTIKRYLWVMLNGTTGSNLGARHYAFFGVSTGNSNSYCQSTVGSQAVYFYKDTYTTSSSSIAQANCDTWICQSDESTMATYYLYFRRCYTLSFNTHDGTSVSSTTIYAGVPYTATQTSTRTGYTFAGWGFKATGDTPSKNLSLSADRVNGNITLHAYWTPIRCAVTLHDNFPDTAGTTSKGTFSDGSTLCYAEYGSQTFYRYSTGSTVATIIVPTCTGYNFYGYYTATSAGTQIIDSSGTLVSNWTRTSNLNVYAQWQDKSYAITLDFNGGTRASGAPSSVYAEYYQALTFGGLGTSYHPTKSGYTFGGWTTTRDGSTILIDTNGRLVSDVSGYTDSSRRWIYDGNTTVYAKWIPSVYEITLCWNAPPDDTYTPWGTIYLKYGCGWMSSENSSTYITTLDCSSLVRDGYKFVGFKTVPDQIGGIFIYGQGRLDTNYTRFTSDATVYANWEPVETTLNYKQCVSEYGSDYVQSSSGGSVTVTYCRDENNTTKQYSWDTSRSEFQFSDVLTTYAFTIKATANPGYHFVGFRSGMGNLGPAQADCNVEMSEYSSSYSTEVFEVTMNIYAYFKKDYEIYQGTDGLYYVDYGYAPQTYCGTSVSGATSLGSLEYFGLKGSLYKASNEYYFAYQGKFYKFEPIRWRVSSEEIQWEGYTCKGDGKRGPIDWGIALVSDQVLFGAVFDEGGLGTGSCYYDSTLFNLIDELNNLNLEFDTGFHGQTILEVEYDQFTYDNEYYKVERVVMEEYEAPALRLVGASGFVNYYNQSWSYCEDVVLSDKEWRTTCTDFAAMMLGKNGGDYVDYWTSNLGTYTNEAKIVTSTENYKSLNMQEMSGVRLAFSLPSATYFGDDMKVI